MRNRILGLIVGGIILYLIAFKLLPYLGDRYHGCYLHHDIYIQHIRSRVIKKFVDADNHNDQVIVYLDGTKQPKMMTFSPENLDMYDAIDVGDSIIKLENSIKSTGKDTIFQFHTMCQDSLKKPHK